MSTIRTKRHGMKKLMVNVIKVFHLDKRIHIIVY